MDLRDKFELAEGRTVFLDEIGEMSPYAQVKILRTTETGLKEDPIEKGGRFGVTLVPTDKFGNMLGPGYSQQLQCRVEGKLTGKVIDILDGSYQIQLELPKKEDLNRIRTEISILGEKIYEGLFSKLVQIRAGE